MYAIRWKTLPVVSKNPILTAIHEKNVWTLTHDKFERQQAVHCVKSCDMLWVKGDESWHINNVIILLHFN